MVGINKKKKTALKSFCHCSTKRHLTPYQLWLQTPEKKSLLSATFGNHILLNHNAVTDWDVSWLTGDVTPSMMRMSRRSVLRDFGSSNFKVLSLIHTYMSAIECCTPFSARKRG